MSQAPKKDNFTKYLVVGIIVAVAAMMIIPTVISKTKKVELVYPSAVSADAGYGIVLNGDVTGVPTVDLYEDFQCPICQQFEALNTQYISSLVTEKKAKVVYHIMSFIGEESVRAANAAACAVETNQFLDFHNALYANQPKTENSGEWSNDRIIAIAAASGITSPSFASCVKDKKYSAWVNKAAEAASKDGVNSTPTVKVNGKEIDRDTEYFDAAKFQAAIARG